jgi:nucleotide-binding universal stress UspA family protein
MRVLMATDGSADARGAVEWLLQAPLPADARISVIGAMPVPVAYEALKMAWSELRKQASDVVEQARRRLAERWPEVTGRVVEGDAREVILHAAEDERADLIVVGARGLGAVATFLLGSVSLDVARQAPCPVLVCKGTPRRTRSIIVAVDGSDHARAALRFVCRLPLASDVSLRLVSVAEPLRFPSTAPSIATPHLRAAMENYEDESRRRLDDVLAAAVAEVPDGTDVSTATAIGPLAPSILAEADKHASDLIVVGARGLGAVKRVLLGSVSEAVLRHATCPVLVVHPRGGERR